MACIYKINGKTFNTTEEIQNYVSSDEFVSVLAKGNSGISKEVRNLILNKDEKTNEVREIEDGQNETKNEGIKSKGKNDGQKTNDVQNEEVTEGGVKAPDVSKGSGVGGDVESFVNQFEMKGNREYPTIDKTKKLVTKLNTAKERLKGLNENPEETLGLSKNSKEFNYALKKTKEATEIEIKETEYKIDKFKREISKEAEANGLNKTDVLKAVESLLSKEQSKAGSKSKSSEPSKSDKNYQEAQEVNAIVSKENPEASVLIQPKGEDLSLTAVYVGKEKRGKGIGSKVLESVKKQADKLGKKVVLDATNELDSETDLEKLDNFYKKNGFLKIGENKYEYDPKAKDSSGDIGSRTDDSGTKKSDIAAVTNKGQSDKNVDSAEEVAETSKPKPENVKAIEEATEKEITTVAEKASITPKNAKDLYKVNRKLFGLNKVQALASAITMDRMVGAMAKRAGITKAAMYGRIDFKKDTQENILKADNALFQSVVNGENVTLRNIDVDVVNGFYSPLEKIIAESKQDKMPAKQWLDKFGKGEEAKWTGLTDWLNTQQGSVSKADIQQYLKDNRISVVEVVKGAENLMMASNKQEAIAAIDAGFLLTDSEGVRISRERLEDKRYPEPNYPLEVDDLQTETKFQNYQLEGEKENYKEVLVTLPSKTKEVSYTIFKEGNEWKAKDNATGEVKKGGWKSETEVELWVEGRSGKVYDSSANFNSTHFDEPNILVHLRMNTRTDSEGNKVLFLEEVQSDWGQQGKKEGFKNTSEQEDIIKKSKEKIDEYNKSLEKLGRLPNLSTSEIEDFKKGKTERNSQIDKEINKLEKYKDTVRNNRDWDAANQEIEKLENEKIEIKKQILANFKGIEEQNKIIDSAEREITRSSDLTPTAPFVTDTNAWTKLGLKVALKEAIKQGVDKIAWTTGEQQNERYDLSKQVDEVRYNPREKILRTKNVDGTQSVFENVSENKIEDYIGKEPAKNLINSELDKNGLKIIKGEGLKIGGKGMKGFYGSPTEGSLGIVGNMAKSLFKQEPKVIDLSPQRSAFRMWDKKTNEFLGSFDGEYTFIDKDDNESKKMPENYKTAKQVSSELGYNINDVTVIYTGETVANLGTREQNSIDVTPELKAQVQQGLALFQKEQGVAKGAMVAADGRFIIYALTDPNVSTPLHELVHVFEHYLTDAEKLAVKNWAGTKQWDVQTSEKFARGFEKYLAEGKAPNSALEKVFANFKEWLTEIYNGIVGSDIDIELNDDMRELYSKMLGEDFSTQKQEATPQVKEANVKAIEEAMTKKSGTIKNEIIKEAADPTEVKKILDNLDAIKSKLAGFTTKDGDRIFSEECKWG
jgi:predicted GNAT family acetyltransferase